MNRPINKTNRLRPNNKIIASASNEESFYAIGDF